MVTAQLEAKLSRAARAYLADYKSGDRVEAERSQELCSTLARFFSELVRNQDRWNRFYWVDDLAPISVKVDKPRVEIDGYLIGGEEKQSYQWIEPFWASLEIDENVRRLRTYRITSGDANTSFGSIPYREGLYSRHTPEEWFFVFARTID